MTAPSKVEGNRRPKTGGRVKGTPNKTSAALKDMILQALDEAGGVQYLKTTAATNAAAFLTLVGKVLPLQVAGDADNPLKMVHTVERVIVRPPAN
jgi:hypothetical protein